MKLGYKKLTPEAKAPAFQSDGAACFDVACIDGGTPQHSRARVYRTGLAFDIPDGYYLEFNSRSGHGFKGDLRLANSTGIVDSDYTGEVMVKLTYDGPNYAKPEWPWAGERIAQARLVRCVKTDIVEIEEMKQTERGNDGFGSTGK